MNTHTPAEYPHHTEEPPMRAYYMIYGALMTLLILTVWVNYLDIGRWALPAALTIAVLKAILVIIYFMHLRTTGKLMWLWFVCGFVWLGMMLFGVLTDVVMRMR